MAYTGGFISDKVHAKITGELKACPCCIEPMTKQFARSESLFRGIKLPDKPTRIDIKIGV